MDRILRPNSLTPNVLERTQVAEDVSHSHYDGSWIKCNKWEVIKHQECVKVMILLKGLNHLESDN